MTAKLTVILPVFNGMPFLPAAVESILHQTFTDFTFLIINDGSTDESGSYLSSLKDARIVVINQANQGLGATLNRGLRMTESEYVARMDADDISMTDRFTSQLEYLDAHPDVVMTGTQIEFLIGSVSQRAMSAPIDHDQIENRLMKGRAGLCHPSLMFRTAAAIACGGYPTGVFGEDIDFCLRMCEQGRVANLGRILLQYRLQGAQMSMARTKELIQGNQFAAYRASFRRKGMPVPSFDEFARNTSLIGRWRLSIEAWELIQYRTGRILLASGRPLSGVLRLALLGLCRPASVFRRISDTIRTSYKKRARHAPA